MPAASRPWAAPWSAPAAVVAQLRGRDAEASSRCGGRRGRAAPRRSTSRELGLDEHHVGRVARARAGPRRRTAARSRRRATVDVEVGVAASTASSVGPTATTTGAAASRAAATGGPAVRRASALASLGHAHVDAAVAGTRARSSALELVGMPGHWMVQPGSVSSSATSPGAWWVRPDRERRTSRRCSTSTAPTPWWPRSSLTCSKGRSTRNGANVCTIGRSPVEGQAGARRRPAAARGCRR